MPNAVEQYDQDYENATIPEKREWKPIPTGTYLCELIEFKHSETKTGKDMLSCTFQIHVGPMAGKKLFKNMVINVGSADSMKYLKADLANLGLGGYKLSEVILNPEVRMMAMFRMFKIYTKIKTNTMNGRDENAVYINGIVDENKQMINRSAKPNVSQVDTQNPPGRGPAGASDDEPPF